MSKQKTAVVARYTTTIQLSEQFGAELKELCSREKLSMGAYIEAHLKGGGSSLRKKLGSLRDEKAEIERERDSALEASALAEKIRVEAAIAAIAVESQAEQSLILKRFDKLLLDSSQREDRLNELYSSSFEKLLYETKTEEDLSQEAIVYTGVLWMTTESGDQLPAGLLATAILKTLNRFSNRDEAVDYLLSFKKSELSAPELEYLRNNWDDLENIERAMIELDNKFGLYRHYEISKLWKSYKSRQEAAEFSQFGAV